MGDGMGWVGLGWGGRRGQESWDGWVGSGVGVRCWGGGPRSSKCMKAKPRVCVLWVGGGGGGYSHIWAVGAAGVACKALLCE